MGGSDAFYRAFGSDEDVALLRGSREEHPYLSFGSEVAGAIPIAIATGGASVPGTAAELGATAARGIGGRLLSEAAVGAAFGAGQGISEVALAGPTDRRARRRLFRATPFTPRLGGGLGLAGRAAESAPPRPRARLDAALTSRFEGGITIAPEIAALDRAGLNAARKAETDAIEAVRAPQRKALVDEIDGYQNANRDAEGVRGVAGSSGDRNITEAGGAFVRNDLELRRLLDDRVGLAEDPRDSASCAATSRRSSRSTRGGSAGPRRTAPTSRWRLS
jgi:hypothetical protein